MKKKLFKNWGLKLASLVLACILWLLVVRIDDPTKPVTFNNIKVKLVNTELLDQENKVYEVLDHTDTVKVTINAPTSIAEQIRPTDISAEADISKLTDINTVAINYYINYEVNDIQGDHDVVRLSVEDKKSKWVKLQYRTVGEVADGYMVANVSPDQTLVEVTGPESVIDQVSYAGVDIGVTGATNDLSANVEVQLYDSEGNLMESSGIKKNVDYVHIAVDVLAVKEVPIEVTPMGNPAKGYLATGKIECEPSSVKIAGSSYALAGINKISIPEDKLDITDATENVVEVINIKEYLPENVRLATSGFGGKIQATVYVEPEIQKTLEIPAENIAVINIPEGLQAELSEDELTYILKVSGLGEIINPLTVDSLKGTVDIAAWMLEEEKETLHTGNYKIPILFNIPEEAKQDKTVYAGIVVSKPEN